MSDWQAGDLALCVRVAPNWFGDPHPCKKGALYTVEKVVMTPDGQGLTLVGVLFKRTKQNADTVENYRKVTPPAADEFDRETIALMNGVRVGEPA